MKDVFDEFMLIFLIIVLLVNLFNIVKWFVFVIKLWYFVVFSLFMIWGFLVNFDVVFNKCCEFMSVFVFIWLLDNGICISIFVVDLYLFLINWFI